MISQLRALLWAKAQSKENDAKNLQPVMPHARGVAPTLSTFKGFYFSLISYCSCAQGALM